MAATRKANVVVVDGTGGNIPYGVEICFFLYVPGTGTPTATVADAGGTVIWEAYGANRICEQINIDDKQGVTVALAGTGTKLYIYLE